jgi:hypothetical protein
MRCINRDDLARKGQWLNHHRRIKLSAEKARQGEIILRNP